MKHAHAGPISYGTLRLDDLLAAFADELERLVQINAPAWCGDEGIARRDHYVNLVWEAREVNTHADPDVADDICTALIEVLNDFAPRDHTFGAHWGDGAMFGYWPDEAEGDRDEEAAQ